MSELKSKIIAIAQEYGKSVESVYVGNGKVIYLNEIEKIIKFSHIADRNGYYSLKEKILDACKGEIEKETSFQLRRECTIKF